MPAFPDEYERSVVDALPVHLERELRARARHYGMTENQFIVAMLGHIAWRTPFAEDVAPWEAWLPESAQHALRVVSDPDP